MLWTGPQQPADQPGAFWVFYVRIEEAHQGKGYGRAAMELAESEARSRGASELGLNVFGHNQVAPHLCRLNGLRRYVNPHEEGPLSGLPVPGTVIGAGLTDREYGWR
jgi:GNAT superfamily N-acetyltransferase